MTEDQLSISEPDIFDMDSTTVAAFSFRAEWDARIKELKHTFHLFSKSPLFIFGAIMMSIMIGLAVLAPFITNYGPSELNFRETLAPPGSQDYTFYHNWQQQEWTNQSITTNGKASPILADFTNDGLLDLVIVDNSGLTYYINDGTDTHPNFVIDETPNSMPSDSAWGSNICASFGDMDYDSDLDCIIGDDNGKLWLYENNGTVTSPQWTKMLYPGWKTNELYVGGQYSFPELDFFQDPTFDEASVQDWTNNGFDTMVIGNGWLNLTNNGIPSGHSAEIFSTGHINQSVQFEGHVRVIGELDPNVTLFFGFNQSGQWVNRNIPLRNTTEGYTFKLNIDPATSVDTDKLFNFTLFNATKTFNLESIPTYQIDFVRIIDLETTEFDGSPLALDGRALPSYYPFGIGTGGKHGFIVGVGESTPDIIMIRRSDNTETNNTHPIFEEETNSPHETTGAKLDIDKGRGAVRPLVIRLYKVADYYADIENQKGAEKTYRFDLILQYDNGVIDYFLATGQVSDPSFTLATSDILYQVFPECEGISKPSIAFGDFLNLTITDWENKIGSQKPRSQFFVLDENGKGYYISDYFVRDTRTHIFGTDYIGGDVLNRCIWALQTDLLLALWVVLVAVIIGTTLGSFAGFYGGIIDQILMRITDIFFAFPGLILAMSISAALGPSMFNLSIALIIVWWSGYSRIVRGQVLIEREKLYVEAARALGYSDIRIIFKQIIPNCIYPIIVAATMDLGSVILTAAGLSFIGFGAQPSDAELGIMIADNRDYFIPTDLNKGSQWWGSFFPGVFIFISVLSFSLIGDGLRDVLDPKARR